MTDSFAERRLGFTGDPLRIATAWAAQSPGPYVLYENHGQVCWAEGAHLLVRIMADRVLVDQAGTRRSFDAHGDPLATAGACLESIAGQAWRAYGWVSFELEGALHGRAHSRDAVLGCLMVPRREVRFGRTDVVLRAIDSADLGRLQTDLSDSVPGATAARATGAMTAAVDIDYGADAYRAAVTASIDAIRSGRVDKVVLSRVVPISGEIDVPASYLRGRRANDPARSFLIDIGGWQAAGFSPEIVARVGARGEVMSQPLAGTRALLGNAADQDRRAELVRDPKEVFEHAISVRIAADELSAVCAGGTVGVREFMTVKERGSVQHLASELVGVLAPGRNRWDALAALFPAVTASGVPKAAACQLIGELEPVPRELYGGAVLTVDCDGDLDAALTLRAVFRHGGHTWLRAGAGIVAQSSPERELEETKEKLRSVSRHLVSAEPSVQGTAAAGAVA